ncbi:STAS domain-containing protein [Mangrovicoccus algicola]|uniref:STAS domain-containing protein n=1 Tax=Mangrovicoccus algicola TaxID=2771008 RepID=A0A8J6Z1A4_9RHOB|nr:STAS domain-containing protein [Mangrovicoccus algicola]MBE3639833.1 STAS domain-containing protein [Mangrovicoccus algicola]
MKVAGRVAILRQGRVLIASLQEALGDSDILGLQSDILRDVIRHRATGVIVDVSALDVLDSFGTRTLADMAAAVQLRGARLAIVGIQPDVAFSMVLMGLTLTGVATARDLETGLALLTGAGE